MTTIIIVDDHENNRYLLKTILENAGYEVLAAANGSEALGLAHRTLPNLIISDVLMPQMDGFSLCRQCKLDPELNSIPFVFYTATYTDPQDESLALSLGAARFIVKPVEYKEFVALINEVLQDHSAENLPSPSPVIEEETEFYRLYNESLINKLEDKMLNLQKLNQTLAENEERLQYQAMLLENVSDAVISMDNDFRVVSWNQAAENTYGWKASEAIGKVLHKLVPLEYPQSSFEEALEHFHQHSSWQGEIIEQTKSGEKIQVLSSATALRDRSGAVSGIVVVNRDISRLKHMEVELRESQKLVDIGTLTASIAHEIKSPLQVITMVAESLGRQVQSGELLDQESVFSRLEMLQRNVGRINKIAQALLNYSRSKEDQKVAGDLNEIVREALYLTRHQLEVCSNVQVTTDLAPDLPQLVCNSNKLIQVIINLLLNARDAMPNGGRVCISTAGAENGKDLVLIVTDNGRGIPKDLQEKIFTPFYTTKPTGQGTGLGLSIVQDIVKSHEGHIELESTPGKGSVFTITLPHKWGEKSGKNAVS